MSATAGARRRLDVSPLPSMAFGNRDPIFWGVVCLIAIETTMFVLLVASYFYARLSFPRWPPEGVNPISMKVPVAGLVVLLLSAWPTRQLNKNALAGSLRGMRLWTWVLVGFGALFLFFRFLEFHQLDFSWKSHLYGSMFWGLLVMHTLHAITGTLENAAFGALLVKGPVEDKLRTDVQATGVYWYVIIAWWVGVFAVLYVEGGMLR
jgi:cytochrome c oxidase subunit III